MQWCINPGWLNCSWWCLIFVSPQFGNCIMPPFWHLELEMVAAFLENSCISPSWIYLFNPKNLRKMKTSRFSTGWLLFYFLNTNWWLCTLCSHNTHCRHLHTILIAMQSKVIVSLITVCCVFVKNLSFPFPEEKNSSKSRILPSNIVYSYVVQLFVFVFYSSTCSYAWYCLSCFYCMSILTMLTLWV